MGLSFFIFSDFGDDDSSITHQPLSTYFCEEEYEEQMENFLTYNMDYAGEFFNLLCSILQFIKVHSRLPGLFNNCDSNELLSLFQEYQDSRGIKSDISEKIIEKFAQVSQIEIPLVSEICGALTSTEIIKSVVKRLYPLNQVLFWENFQLLSQIKNLTENNLKNLTQSCDLFDYKVLFGEELMKRIDNLKILLVGCGAVGCEQVKNLFQMGACRGEGGHLFLVDDDLIERSNLPRQVLFTEEDVKKNKAETCEKWIKSRDPLIKVTSFNKLICEATEDTFNFQFFESIDIIIVAVDSIEGRHYLADKAILHNKFLIESGTEGFGAQSSSQVPYFQPKISIAAKQKITTASCYSKSALKTEGDALIYSKTFFNSEISNLREKSGNFLSKEELIKICSDYHSDISNSEIEIDQKFKKHLQKVFTDIFYYDVQSIGDKYSPIQFDSTNSDHVQFVECLFSILKTAFLIAKESFKNSPSYNSSNFLTQINDASFDFNQIFPSFDKDNFIHGDLVYQIANIRAKCFNICMTLDRNDTVSRIGDIIPAIIQSTSTASGFALLELFTWMVHQQEIENLYQKVQQVNLSAKCQVLKEQKDQESCSQRENQIYLNNEFVNEIKVQFEQYGFLEYFGNVSQPEDLGRFYSRFQLKSHLNNYTISVSKSTPFSEIIEEIDRLLTQNDKQQAYIITLSKKVVYRRDAETSKYTQSISKVKLMNYLNMNFKDVAKSELKRDVTDTAFHLSVFNSKLNLKMHHSQGFQFAQIKLLLK